MPFSSSTSPERADSGIGTSWARSAWRRAVTISSATSATSTAFVATPTAAVFWAKAGVAMQVAASVEEKQPGSE